MQAQIPDQSPTTTLDRQGFCRSPCRLHGAVEQEQFSQVGLEPVVLTFKQWLLVDPAPRPGPELGVVGFSEQHSHEAGLQSTTQTAYNGSVFL